MSEICTICNVSLVDIAKGVVIPDCTVILRNGEIHDVCHGESVSVGRIKDATGLYLCPGLIDSHVHLFLDCGSSPRTTFMESDEEAKIECARRNAQTAIEAGITTVRDCGAPAELMFYFQRNVEQGHWPGPYIISCGCPLTRPKGHCHFMGGEVATIEEICRLIEWQFDQGASFVKLMASGGGLTPGTDPYVADFPLQLMKSAREIAQAHGAMITAHCHAVESIVRAVDAGFDMIEHASFVVPPGKHSYDQEVTKRLSDGNVAVCPTIISALRTAEHFRQTGRSHNPDDRGAVERLERRLDNTRHFHRSRIKIIGGTDCGVTNTPFNSLVEEIMLYKELGFTNTEALRTVTSEAAAFLNLSRVGEIRIGYKADLICVSGNPLEELSALWDPVMVFKSGQLVHERSAFNVHKQENRTP